MGHTESKKTFDCVEFKRAAQARIYEEIRGMTHEQQIEYFNRHARSGRLGAWWQKLSREAPPGPKRE